MNMYELCCDVDGQSHGLYSSGDKLINHASAMIVKQPFHQNLSVEHLYVVKFTVDTDTSEVIDYNDFLRMQ